MKYGLVYTTSHTDCVDGEILEPFERQQLDTHIDLWKETPRLSSPIALPQKEWIA